MSFASSPSAESAHAVLLVALGDYIGTIRKCGLNRSSLGRSGHFEALKDSLTELRQHLATSPAYASASIDLLLGHAEFVVAVYSDDPSHEVVRARDAQIDKVESLARRIRSSAQADGLPPRGPCWPPAAGEAAG